MAKAGASERWTIEKNYQWAMTPSEQGFSGNSSTLQAAVAYPIPYATNGGLFEDTNRDDFYTWLHGTRAKNGTPLQGALQRAARYYQTDGPWKIPTGSLTCRQNYAILTTDGYWNDNSGYTNVGNADAAANTDIDGNHPHMRIRFRTPCDVAYKYWSTDLNTTMADNVLTSAADPPAGNTW